MKVITRVIEAKYVCAYCGRPAEGQFSIDQHNGDLPDVMLCNNCGGRQEPHIEAIQNRIGFLEPAVFWLKVANGLLSPNPEDNRTTRLEMDTPW
jgi:DNA-directed RNA polymerase subunit RPC12/RpoP